MNLGYFFIDICFLNKKQHSRLLLNTASASTTPSSTYGFRLGATRKEVGFP